MLTIASAELPPDRASISAARDLVNEVTAQLPRCAREAAELVTAALVRHSIDNARTPLQLFAAVDDEAVEVVVSDGTGWSASLQGSDSGHELLLVELLASDWAATVEGAGKRVWARLLVDDVPTA